MASVIIMSVGLLLFIAGLLSYIKKSEPPLSRTIDNTSGEPEVENEMAIDGLSQLSAPEQPVDSSELGNSIAMALADGVLTNNEKSLIKKLADQKGLDSEAILRETESKMAMGTSDTAETQLIDPLKKNGDDFEKFVVQKFNRKYFSIKEWAGDKYINGYYASTTQHPDLLMAFKLKNQTFDFAVECKWRSFISKEGVSFATPEQFSRYQDFEKQRGIPVFIALGIGGTGSAPEHLYIVPLKSAESPLLSRELLRKHRKWIEKDFYFDEKAQELK